MKRNCVKIFCLLMALLLLSGCAASEINPETTAVYMESGSEISVYATETPDRDRPYFGCVGELTLDEVLERADYIADGEFVGYYPMAEHDQLTFRITKTYRGELVEADVILVFPLQNWDNRIAEGKEKPTYEIGRKYLLFLSKDSGPLSTQHQNYWQTGEYYLNDSEEPWEDVHTYVEQQIAAGVGPAKG